MWEEDNEPLLRGDHEGRLMAHDNYRVARGASPLSIQRIPAAHPAATITGLACLARFGPGGLFPPEHPPGREAQSDFTHGKFLLGVTIAGRPFPHLLFQLILNHSGW